MGVGHDFFDELKGRGHNFFDELKGGSSVFCSFIFKSGFLCLKPCFFPNNLVEVLRVVEWVALIRFLFGMWHY